MSNVSESEMAKIAKAAAKEALQEFMIFLDVDTSDHLSVRSLREDLEFLRDQRRGSQMLKDSLRKSMFYVIGTVFLGFIYFMWDVIKVVVLAMISGIPPAGH